VWKSERAHSIPLSLFIFLERSEEEERSKEEEALTQQKTSSSSSSTSSGFWKNSGHF